MSTLTSNRNFDRKAFERSAFWQVNGEGAINIEGIVAIDGESLVANLNVDSTSASYGGTYIGKVTGANNEDFNVAYTAAATVTFSNYPAGITGFHADDIEFIRQIDTNGAVTETYTRDDATMSITGDVLTVTGAAFVATDTFVVLTNVQAGGGASSGSSVGGGNNTYSNASGDFTAVITDSTANITVTGLPFTLEDKHVAMGAIKLITSAGVVTSVALSDIAVAAGVITVADQPDFSTGDVVVVSLIGPDKAYDVATDSGLTTVLNPEYGHYTSVEYLINESNLGIDGTQGAASGSATVFDDDASTFTAETIAEGFPIYNLTDVGVPSGIITADTLVGYAGDGGAGTPAADSITHAALTGGTSDDWQSGETASIPECKRFVIPVEGYNIMSVDIVLDSQDANNACYVKIYATNDDTADDTDDVYWKDKSADVFGGHSSYDATYAALAADGIGGAARTVTQDIFFVDTPTVALKWMIKVVAVNDDGTQDNEFKIRIKKSSNS